MIAAFARMARALDGHGADGRTAAQPYLDAVPFAQRRSFANRCGMRIGRAVPLLPRRPRRNCRLRRRLRVSDFGLLELFQAQSEPMWLEWACPATPAG